MANGNKHAMDRNFQIRLASSRGQTQSRDTAIIAQNLGDLTIPENLDFLMPSSRSCMICSARSASRRCTSVTFSQILAR